MTSVNTEDDEEHDVVVNVPNVAAEKVCVDEELDVFSSQIRYPLKIASIKNKFGKLDARGSYILVPWVPAPPRGVLEIIALHRTRTTTYGNLASYEDLSYELGLRWDSDGSTPLGTAG